VGPESGQQQKTDQNVRQRIRRSVPSLRVCNLVNSPRSSSKQIESFQKEGEVDLDLLEDVADFCVGSCEMYLVRYIIFVLRFLIRWMCSPAKTC